MSTELNALISAAKEGGKILNEYFGKSLKPEIKSIPSDFRTKADLESEQAILNILEKHFPTANIFSEESGVQNKNGEYSIIIDPLDGTNNFVLGLPLFTSSIGLQKLDETIAAVVYNPFMNHLYTAEKNSGAKLNGRKIHVNQEERITHSTISYVEDYSASADEYKAVTNAIEELDIKRLINFWSPNLDLCLLASGKIEGIVFNQLQLYDFIPGKLIAKEAGAIATDWKNKPEISDSNSTFVISNEKIHPQLCEALSTLPFRK